MVIYLDKLSGKSEHLLDIVRSVMPEEVIEICKTLTCLSEALKRRADKQPILLIVPSNNLELKKLAILEDMLFRTMLILVLPTEDEAGTSLAHSLRPRFLAYQDSDLNRVGLVIEKIHRMHPCTVGNQAC